MPHLRQDLCHRAGFTRCWPELSAEHTAEHRAPMDRVALRVDREVRRDRDFLHRTAWPPAAGAACFALDLLHEDEYGWLVT